MNEVQKSIIWMLVVGAAFLGGTLFESWQETKRKQMPLAVAGVFSVLTLDMVDARATAFVNPADPIYFCVKEAAHEIASRRFAQAIQLRPSKIWLASRDMTRAKCGRAITILIDVPELRTEQ